MRRVIRTGGLEEIGGYARAVRIENVIAVGGVAAIDADGKALHPGDVYAQTRDALERSLAALRELGGGLRDVLRTRIYLAPGADPRRALDAHREVFGDTLPANTTLYVAGFMLAGVLVEVELDAVA